VSFLSFANPEKGDPKSGMFILLSYFLPGFRLGTDCIFGQHVSHLIAPTRADTRAC